MSDNHFPTSSNIISPPSWPVDITSKVELSNEQRLSLILLKANDIVTTYPPGNMRVKVDIAPSIIQIVAFEIEYQTTYISWKVIRSLDQLTNLYNQVNNTLLTASLTPLPTKSDLACLTSPGVKEKLEQIIETLLNQVIQFHELWTKDFFTQFISDSDNLLKLLIMHDKTLHYCMKLEKENEQLKIEMKRNIQSSVTPSSSSSSSSSPLVSEQNNNSNSNSNSNTIVEPNNISPVMDYDKSFNTWSSPVITTDNMNYLLGNSIPNNIQPTLLDKKIINIIHSMCPTFETIYRQGLVYTYVTNLIKKALGATCYESGAYSIHINLPNEAIQITPFLCQGQEKNWYIKVNEILSNNNNGEVVITDIQFIYTNNINIVKCVVNSVPLEIISNNYSDLCFHTFIEEIDENIKNNLLKLTIIFIKSFCVYDYYKYCHINILSYITDYGLYTLILHIFYVYGQNIHNPLQAFFYFIFEYQSLDWQNNVVMLDRIESLNSYSNNNNKSLDIKDNPFFPSSVMVNYIQLYNKPNQRKKSEDTTVGITSFVNQSINIENPLSPNHNLISQPIKDFKEDILPGLFTFAQHKINHLLQLYTNQNSNSNNSTEIENKVIEELFEETLTKTGISSSIFDPVNIEANYFLSLTQNSLAMDIKILYDRLEHSAYLLENEVTENALLSLTVDILKDKGPSPVGEIGKLLQDCLSCDNLTQTLREQFGGLKKFLEKYPEIFAITKNHPYNPYVFLTEQLNDDCYKHLLNNINNPTNVKGKKNKRISNNERNRKIIRDGYSSSSGGGGSSDNNGYEIGLITPYNDSYISYSLPNYNTSNYTTNNSNVSYSFDASYYSISPPSYSNSPLPQQLSSSSTTSLSQQQQQQQTTSSPTQILRSMSNSGNGNNLQQIGASNIQYMNTSPTQYQCNYNPNDYYRPSSFC